MSGAITNTGTPPQEDPFASGSDEDHGSSNHSQNGDASSDQAPINATAHESTTEKPPTKKRDKVKAHFRKSWKYYALGIVIALAVFLPLLFKVFIPLIIQRLINSRHIGLEHAYVSIKSSDTIEYSANATVKSPLPVRVGNLQFILRDPAVENPPTVITSNIDGFPVARSARIEIVDRVLNINNTDGLVQWADKFIDSDERPFDVDVKDLGIYLGKLHYKGNVKLPVVVNGLQGLKDITLEKLKLNLKPADGKNVKATVSLSNPSSLSVAVGNLTIALRVNGIDIGNAYTYNLFLVPGRNLVDIDGLVDIPAILNNIGLIIGSQMQSIQNGSVHAELKVTKFVVDGKEIEFLQTLLKDRVLDVRVPIVRLLDGAVTGVLKSGMLGTGQLNGTDFGSQTILGAVGDVLANKTLINRIGGHWNRRKLAKLQLEAL